MCLSVYITRLIILTLLALGYQSASAEISTPPNIVEVALTNLRAGQFDVGYIGVSEFAVPTFQNIYLTGWELDFTGTQKKYWGPGPEGLVAYQTAKPAPVYAGPILNGTNPTYHLLDNHHRTTALYRLSTTYTTSTNVTVTNNLGVIITTNIGAAPSSVRVEVKQDWSAKTTNQFWVDMQKGNTGGVISWAPVEPTNSLTVNGFADSTNQPTYVWTKQYGIARDVNLLPYIPDLTDDTLRSVAGDLAKESYGYLERDGAKTSSLEQPPVKGEVLYYQEFYYADFLRDKVYWETAETTAGQNPNATEKFTDYNALLLRAGELVNQPGAMGLPGYQGIPEPSSIALVVFGVGTLLVLKRRRSAVE